MVYVLAVLAALSNALTSVFQRMGVEDAPEESTMRLSLMAHAIRRGVWLLGFGFMICAFLLQAFALHIGRLSVVQPILTMELLFLVFILGTYFRFSISVREWVGRRRHRLWALRLPLLRRPGRRGAGAHQSRLDRGRRQRHRADRRHGGGHPLRPALVEGRHVRHRSRHLLCVHGRPDQSGERLRGDQLGDLVRALADLRRHRVRPGSASS